MPEKTSKKAGNKAGKPARKAGASRTAAPVKASVKKAPVKRAPVKKVPVKRAASKRAAAAKATAETRPLSVPYFDAAGARHGEFELPGAIFAEKPNLAVMHQAHRRQLANGRQGTAATKTRATVSGGGAKPYRQKGTGRARHGSTREPSMKGGAAVFGPQPRSYAQRMPRQMRRLALRSALSQKAIDSEVSVIETFAFEEPKTRQAADLIGAIGFEGTTLVVLPAPNYVVSRSFDNLSGTKIILARNLNLHDLFTHKYLLLAKEAVDLIEDNFSARQKESA